MPNNETPETVASPDLSGVEGSIPHDGNGEVFTSAGTSDKGTAALFTAQSLPVRVLLLALGSIAAIGIVAGAGYGLGQALGSLGRETTQSSALQSAQSSDNQSGSTASQSHVSEGANEPSPSSPHAAERMNPHEIAQGNYSSVAGQWVNILGHVMTVEADSFTFLHEGAPNFRVLGLEIPEGGASHAFASAVVTKHPGEVIQLQWVDQKNGFPYENGAVFFPQGTEVEYWQQKAHSDSTRERILAVGAGYASGRDLPQDLSPFIFYRIPAGQSPAAVVEELAMWRGTSAAAKTATCTPPVLGAYACAGGAAPENAIKLSSAGVTGVGALVRSPSGNIRCGISGQQHDNGYGFLRCYVKSWHMENRFTPESNGGPDGGIPHVAFDKGVPVYKQLGTAPGEYMFEGQNDVTTEMSYGNVYTYGPFACASEETGVTCWNVETGHGALMNKGEFSPF